MPEELDISKVKAGMRVIAPVYAGGMLLVHAGTDLTDELIATLQRRGIEEVVVETEPDTDPRADYDTDVILRPPADLSDKATRSLTKVLAKLEAQFAGFEGDPIMMPILVAASEYWTHKTKEWDTAHRIQT